VVSEIPILKNKSIIIPHGISDSFFIFPRTTKPFFDSNERCKIIYVSKTDPYKHHCNVIKAIELLIQKKYMVELILIGPKGSSASEVENLLNHVDPTRLFTKNLGPIPFEEINSYYGFADIAVFASSCENMPIILLESMASGLPIACSNMGPMPEILGDNAIYFNPDSVDEIFRSIELLINSSILRERLAMQSFLKAKSYSWDVCAGKTFDYLNFVFENYNKKN